MDEEFARQATHRTRAVTDGNVIAVIVRSILPFVLESFTLSARKPAATLAIITPPITTACLVRTAEWRPVSVTRSDCPLFSEGTTLMRFMRTAAVVVGLIVAVAMFGSTSVETQGNPT